MFRAICVEKFAPGTPRIGAARADSCSKVLVNPVGNQKLRILRPSIISFCKPDLFFAKRLTVGVGGILLVRSAISDVTVQHNQCGTALRVSEDFKCVLDAICVVGIADSQHVPSVTQESCSHVLSERDART